MKSTEKQIREINYVKRICRQGARAYMAKQAEKEAGEKKKKAKLSPSEKAEIELGKRVERLMNSIGRTIPEGCKISRDKPAVNSVALAIFKVTRPLSEQEREQLRQAMEEWNETHPCDKQKKEKNLPKEAKLMAVHIYRSYRDYHKIGSIAIYGADVEPLCEVVKRTHSYHGLPVADAKIEYGLSPYLDIAIRS